MPSAPVDNSALFSPLRVGNMDLQHRIVMAPLTRMRASTDHCVHDVHAEYYGQRAETPGTLLISEATFISAQAGGYTNAPGCYSDDQVSAWKKVVDAGEWKTLALPPCYLLLVADRLSVTPDSLVHAKGSYIYLQLWALGRAADPNGLKADDPSFEVVSASDIPFEGGAKPRPLTEAEIQTYVADYAACAKRFVEEAGGDGVEIHSANGEPGRTGLLSRETRA